jgi:hypothetical protein
MTEEEKMVFWGDLVEPITALVGGLLVRGEYKLVDVVKDIVAKAENAALEEREACASVEVHLTTPDRDYTNMSPLDAYEAALIDAAIAFREAIRARGQR